MNFEINKNYGYIVKVKLDNGSFEESVDEGVYAQTEDGKKDFNKRIMTDITTDFVSNVIGFTEDVIYYRQRDFDSSNLIEQLFEKLPSNVVEELLDKLNEKYEKD